MIYVEFYGLWQEKLRKNGFLAGENEKLSRWVRPQLEAYFFAKATFFEDKP